MAATHTLTTSSPMEQGRLTTNGTDFALPGLSYYLPLIVNHSYYLAYLGTQHRC